jgi:predicted DNA-binding transcriptional regulator AlpA
MVQKRFYNIAEIATILGKSVAAIHGHLARKQFDVVPPPMRLGRRLAWLVESVDSWIEAKADRAAAQAEEYMGGLTAKVQTTRRGRPTKAEVRARERFASASD